MGEVRERRVAGGRGGSCGGKRKRVGLVEDGGGEKKTKVENEVGWVCFCKRSKTGAGKDLGMRLGER